MLRYNRIKEELKNQDRNVPWLAKKTGIDKHTLYNYANNIHQPRVDVLARIAKALNVETKSLIVEGTERFTEE